MECLQRPRMTGPTGGEWWIALLVVVLKNVCLKMGDEPPIYSHFKWWRWLWIIGFLGLPMGADGCPMFKSSCSVLPIDISNATEISTVSRWLDALCNCNSYENSCWQLFWFLFLMPLYCHIGSAFRLSWAMAISSPLWYSNMAMRNRCFFWEKHVLITKINIADEV